MFIATVFVFRFTVHADKLGQVTIVGVTAKHCVDQYMVLVCYCLLGGNTAMPGGLHARLCYAFLVRYFIMHCCTELA